MAIKIVQTPARRWPAAVVRPWAERIAATLAPYCVRCEIAGSLRRGRPEVGDVDLVLLPQPGKLRALRERICAQAAVEADGEQNLIVVLRNGLQVDCFFAHDDAADLLGEGEPCNWGTLLLCRTGSREHNIWLAQKAQREGYHWNPYRGLEQNGRVVAARSEGEIFERLGLAWLKPEEREK